MRVCSNYLSLTLTLLFWGRFMNVECSLSSKYKCPFYDCGWGINRNKQMCYAFAITKQCIKALVHTCMNFCLLRTKRNTNPLKTRNVCIDNAVIIAVHLLLIKRHVTRLNKSEKCCCYYTVNFSWHTYQRNHRNRHQKGDFPFFSWNSSSQFLVTLLRMYSRLPPPYGILGELTHRKTNIFLSVNTQYSFVFSDSIYISRATHLFNDSNLFVDRKFMRNIIEYFIVKMASSGIWWWISKGLQCPLGV